MEISLGEIFKTCVILLLAVLVLLISKIWQRHLRNLRMLKSMKSTTRSVIPFWFTIKHMMNVMSSGVDPTAADFSCKVDMVKKFRKEGAFFTFNGNLPMVVVYSGELAEQVIRDAAFSEKSIGYKFLQVWLGQGLLTSNGEYWKKHRRMLTPSFHFRILDEYESAMNHHVIKTMIKMRDGPEKYRSNIEVTTGATNCTMAILQDTVMGMDDSDPEKCATYIDTLNSVAGLFAVRFLKPWNMVDEIYYKTSDGRKFRKAVDQLHQFTREVIEQKIAYFEADPSKLEPAPGKKQAFLDMLIRMYLKEKSISIEEMREQLDTFMFAGHDTTGWGIAWALHQIGIHQEVQTKVLEEIDMIFGDDKTRHVTKEDLQELKYFERVLKECQRMYPSVPAFSRSCIQNGAKLGEYTIPDDAIVSVNIFALHRDPQNFPDPERFDPDRFLPENARGRHPYAFIPFSAGPRNCIGQKFAMQELKIVLVNIFRYFRVTSREKPKDLVLAGEIILRSKNGLHIDFLTR